MSSSGPSTPPPNGNDPSDDRLDFADAAETLIALQEQLREFQDLTDALHEIGASGTDLAAASRDLAEAQRAVADAQASGEAAPADPVSASVSQSVAALHESVRSLKADVQDVADRLDGRGPVRPTVGGAWNTATATIVVLLVALLGLVGTQWATSDPAASSAAPESAEPIVQRTLYPHQSAIEHVVDVRVQVLNGVGQPGLASRFKSNLESAGAKVPAIGNLPIGTAPETRMYLHRNAFAVAQQLADRLGLDRRRILPGPPATDAGVDLTLVVGADYATLTPFQ